MIPSGEKVPRKNMQYKTFGRYNVPSVSWGPSFLGCPRTIILSKIVALTHLSLANFRHLLATIELCQITLILH